MKTKQSDLTVPVMRRIAVFERRRTTAWKHTFRLLVAVLAAVCLALAGFVAYQLAGLETSDMLSILREDSEVLREYWTDAVYVIWLQVPEYALYLSLLVLAALVFLVFSTRRKRSIIARKEAELEKYGTNQKQ